MNLFLIGLGNPGRQYDKTRHNVGFDFIDRIAEKHNVKMKRKLLIPAEVGSFNLLSDKIILVKPLTFMNCSGDIFPRILKNTNMDISNICVICDNLDLPPGTVRLKQKGSSAGQKGLKSIINALSTDLFNRLYIGVGRPLNREDVVEHVLARPVGKEKKQIEGAIEHSVDSLLTLTQQKQELVLNEINSYQP